MIAGNGVGGINEILATLENLGNSLLRSASTEVSDSFPGEVGKG